MDSQKVREYKTRIQSVFSYAKVRGFVDWQHMGELTSSILDLVDEARKEMSGTEDRWDLFSVACAVFLKWGKTDMDDDGDTQMVMSDVIDAWDESVSRLVDEKEQKKALDFFMKYTDGSVIDYMEDYLYRFMDTHFRTPELLQIKRQFLEDKIQQEKASDKDDFLKDIHISIFKDYLLQILSDEGVPIEEVERYAATVGKHNVNDRLLRIYGERGENEKEIALLQELIKIEGNTRYRSYAYTQYEKQLKDLYKRLNRTEEYHTLLKQMFYENPGSNELYDEYRRLFSDEEWQQETKENLFPAVTGRFDAMPLFEKEKQYDLMMDTAETSGYLGEYEKTLKKKYPERCLKILIRNADEAMEQATQRKGYRRVANILKKIKKYPDGESTAKELAEKYRNEYPRRTALRDELNGI